MQKSCIVIALMLAIVLGIGHTDGWSQTVSRDNLSLNVPGTVYVKPGDTVLLDMDVSGLQQPVNACQAFVNFSSSFFLAGSGDVTIVPGGGVWEELIWGTWNTGGDLDMAVGLKLDGAVATKDDGTVAKVTLNVRPGVEGSTCVAFRPDSDPDIALVQSTILSTVAGNPLWPTKSNSPTIIIDATVPSIEIASVSQNGRDISGSSSTAIEGNVSIRVSAHDPIHGGVSSGLAGNPVVKVMLGDGSIENASFVDESPAGVFNYSWSIDSTTPNGQAVVSASIYDLSGNLSVESTSIEINSNKITGSVAIDTLRLTTYSFDRVVTFKATDLYGALLKTWLVPVHFVNDPSTGIAAGDYVLTDVPAGAEWLSAKTDWSLRRRQRVTTGVEAVVVFSGAAKLLGGDVTTDNVVNVADYNTLRTNWFRPVAAADINGDGSVNTLDYNIMKTYWLLTGDPI